MNKLFIFLLGAVLFFQLALCTLLVGGDGVKVYRQHQAAQSDEVSYEAAEQLAFAIAHHGPTYQQITEEANRTVGHNCFGSFNQLSPKQQAQKVIDILGAAPVDLEKVEQR